MVKIFLPWFLTVILCAAYLGIRNREPGGNWMTPKWPPGFKIPYSKEPTPVTFGLWDGARANYWRGGQGFIGTWSPGSTAKQTPSSASPNVTPQWPMCHFRSCAVWKWFFHCQPPITVLLSKCPPLLMLCPNQSPSALFCGGDLVFMVSVTLKKKCHQSHKCRQVIPLSPYHQAELP